VAEVLEHVAGHGAEVMVATHNQASIEATVALMGQLGIEPNENGVCMGQLLGMADHLTFTLGRNGYRVRHLDRTLHQFCIAALA
jgi:proline dehydrogenase